jgi:phospholipid/cholesterol/gamma-HCH transport system substrate-binding protein
MKNFRSRNPMPIGAIGLVVIVLGLLAAFFSDNLPIIGGGTTYKAEFSEAGGLKSDDEVRIAGVKVGHVTDIGLDGDKVLVSFKIKDAWVGDQTRADIKIKTLLGQKFLSLEPDGTQALDPDQPIRRDHTTAPYDVLEAFRGLADTVNQVDTTQLAKSFEVISQTFADTPGDVKGALNGLSQLSRTVSSRDEELSSLLANTSKISETLAARDQDLVKIMQDGNLLLQKITARKTAISNLLTGTQTLATELKGLVADNNKQLGPVLDQLGRLTTMLQRNQDSLAKGIANFAPFVRLFNNTLGNGRWFDNYICGLLPPSIGPINDGGCLAK